MVAEMFQEDDCNFFYFSFNSVVFSGKHLQMLENKRPLKLFLLGFEITINLYVDKEIIQIITSKDRGHEFSVLHGNGNPNIQKTVRKDFLGFL